MTQIRSTSDGGQPHMRVGTTRDRATSLAESTRAQRRCEGDAGVALLEFALVATLLFALLIGTVSGGFALARKNSMTNAVREGGRLGATLPDSATWASSVQSRVDELAGPDLAPSQICVELAVKTSAGENTVRQLPASCPTNTFGPEPSMPTGVEVGDCVVKVRALRNTDFEAVFFSRDLTLEASAVARYERGGTPPCG